MTSIIVLTSGESGANSLSDINTNFSSLNTGKAEVSGQTFSGSISAANLSGTNTGDQTSVSGNAATATALQTARAINGVNFDGTAPITVAAAAGTLTGSSLASGVTSSSLTSVGTLATLTVTAAIAGSVTGNAAGLSATLIPASGGTGVSNNNSATVTSSGNFAYTRTLTNTTNVTFPTSGTLVNTAVATLSSLSSANGSAIPASDTLVGRATTDTMTNKRVNKRVLSLSANSATPAINTDSCDVVHITSQTAAITSFTTNLTGTPVDGDTLRISVTGTTAIALTFGASFEASGGTPLSTTTATTARLDMGFFWNTETSKWRQVAQS